MPRNPAPSLRKALEGHLSAAQALTDPLDRATYTHALTEVLAEYQPVLAHLRNRAVLEAANPSNPHHVEQNKIAETLGVTKGRISQMKSSASDPR